MNEHEEARRFEQVLINTLGVESMLGQPFKHSVLFLSKQGGLARREFNDFGAIVEALKYYAELVRDDDIQAVLVTFWSPDENNVWSWNIAKQFLRGA